MTVTLLGGIAVNTAARSIAVTSGRLYAISPTSLNLWRYTLPGLANTESPPSAWSSPDTSHEVLAVCADTAGGRVFTLERKTSSPFGVKLYQLDTATSFPATKTLLASSSSSLAVFITYNPVTDSIWAIGADLWEVPASGGSFTAVDTTFTGDVVGPPSVDGSGNVWVMCQSGTNSSHTLIIYRWTSTGTRSTVLSEAASGAELGVGLALPDDTYLFNRDTGSGDDWVTITSGGSISATTILDGLSGPYFIQSRTTRIGNVGYLAQAGGESGLTNDIYSFDLGGVQPWRVGRVGWGTRGAWS